MHELSTPTTNEVTTMNITEIKAHNARSGNHFFSPDTMRFFRSRVLSAVYATPCGDALFITSEQFDDDAPRLYSLRRYNHWTGACSTFEDTFQKYESAAAAKRAAVKASA